MKALLYCTKNGKYLINLNFEKYELCDWKLREKKIYAPYSYNGYVIAECEINKVEQIFVKEDLIKKSVKGLKFYVETKSLNEKELLNKSKLNQHEILDYLDFNYGYALHLENIKIYTEARNIKRYYEITNAPPNMMKCYDYFGKEYILISIRPEHLVNILNGKKTIEVRKKILKEMRGLVE